jgi:hypothetical protein
VTHGLWTPGSAGPHEEFVERLHRRITAFAERQGLDEAAVEVELADGALLSVQAITADPGFGFITLCPHAEEGAEREELIVPLNAIRQITLGAPEPARARFGFSVPRG